MNLRNIGNNGSKAKGSDRLEISQLYQRLDDMKECDQYEYQGSIFHVLIPVVSNSIIR